MLPISAPGTVVRRSAVMATCTPTPRPSTIRRGSASTSSPSAKRSNCAANPAYPSSSSTMRGGGCLHLDVASELLQPRRRALREEPPALVDLGTQPGEQANDALLVIGGDDRAAVRQRLEHAEAPPRAVEPVDVQLLRRRAQRQRACKRAQQDGLPRARRAEDQRSAVVLEVKQRGVAGAGARARRGDRSRPCRPRASRRREARSASTSGNAGSQGDGGDAMPAGASGVLRTRRQRARDRWRQATPCRSIAAARRTSAGSNGSSRTPTAADASLRLGVCAPAYATCTSRISLWPVRKNARPG